MISGPDDEAPPALNGINGATGDYGFAPAGIDRLAELARVKRDRRDSAAVTLKADDQRPDYGVRFGVRQDDLASAGWGLVIGRGVSPEFTDALAHLLRLRSGQAGGRYRIFEGEDAPAPDESGLAWLARHKTGPGPADPDKMPYYLLAVGTPAQIGFDWQHDLDTQYAIGRLDFGTRDEFARYAATVVAADGDEGPASPDIAVWAPRNAGDRATALSNRQFVAPLRDELTDHGCSVATHRAEDADKDALARLVADGPRVLLTVSHGIEFDADHPRQPAEQGALVCQEWPGPLRWNREIPGGFVFAGADVPARVAPRLILLFACYGGGTPSHDRFDSAGPPQRRAAVPFSARLPSRLLAAPEGGALAVLAHVDRMWGCSFSWKGVGSQVDHFTDSIRATLAGFRVGHALEPLDARYAQLSAALAQTLVAAHQGELTVPAELASVWTAAQDARSYSLFGDPAVRINSPKEPA